MTKVKIILNGEEIKLHERLKNKLDNIKKIIEKKWDAVLIVSGLERSGKSTVAMTMGWYLTDGKLSMNNFCSGASDAMYKLKSLPDHSVLIIDEGSLVFSSKDAMKTEQKDLIKVLNVIGQKSMILIIVLPSFFDLLKYIAIDRSLFLIHVCTDKNFNRGTFAYYGRKKKSWLYKESRKSYGAKKVSPDWNGDFEEFKPKWFKDYEDVVKVRSLNETFEGSKTRGYKINKIKEMLSTKLPTVIPQLTKEQADQIFQIFKI